jgi:hypothetical protein
MKSFTFSFVLLSMLSTAFAQHHACNSYNVRGPRLHLRFNILVICNSNKITRF